MKIPAGWVLDACGCCLVPPWGLDDEEPGWDEDVAWDWVEAP